MNEDHHSFSFAAELSRKLPCSGRAANLGWTGLRPGSFEGQNYSWLAWSGWSPAAKHHLLFLACFGHLNKRTHSFLLLIRTIQTQPTR